MSTDKLLKTEEIRELCKATQRLYANFKDEGIIWTSIIRLNISWNLDGNSWVRYTPTMHEMYAHIADFISLNGDRGLKNCSEVFYFHKPIGSQLWTVKQKIDNLQENLEALHKKIRYLRISGARAMGQEVNLEDVLKKYVSKLNKHCEILVSCSDEERNCMQACVTACKLRELHASSCNCMQTYVTACKLM